MDKTALHPYFEWFSSYFIELGMNPTLALILGTILNTLLVLVLVTLLDIVVRKVIIRTFKLFSDRTKTTFDDFLMASNFPKYVAHFVPLGIVWYLEPILFKSYPEFANVIYTIIDVMLIILSVYVFRSILRSTVNFLKTKEKYSDKPLESYVQVLMIFAWGAAIFFAVNVLTNFDIKSLATLGAASAALLLIFRDTILGFVASIQVSVNDIVRIGDWITFSKYGADGYVTEINLATVRVQNFDNTFTTIPTYSLISDSFQNWRGMQQSDGRRIKRALHIKQSSVKFLTTKDISELKNIELISNYINHREKDVQDYNASNKNDKSVLLNGRNQTNLGVFRKYIDAYLQQNPAINKDLFLMVRHLAPTDKGLPVEVYCFSNDKRWEEYEHIVSNIFDHLIAAVPYFGLELFELPTGKDLEHLSS